MDQILLPANPDLIRIPFTCEKEEAVLMQPVDSIHLHEINKGRIQAITTLPVAVFDFSILRSLVLDLGLALPPPLFLIHIRQTTSDCFVDRAFFVARFQLKLNGLIIPHVKESLSFTLHSTSSCHRTKLQEISFHVNAKGYYLLAQKDRHPFSAVIDPLDPHRIHLSWWIARSGSDLDRLATGLHVNGIDTDSIRIQVPM